MTTRRTRRTFRSAGLVALAAAAAFSLTACQDGDTDAAGSGGKEPVSASRSAEDGASGGSQSSGGKDEAGAETEASSASRDNAQSSPSEAPSASRTEKLVDGSTAEISQLGEQRYRAKIVNNGDVLGTLETKGHDAALDGNGMYVLLSLNGEIHSWTGAEHTGPGSFSLEGGWKAEVSKAGDNRFTARILGKDGSVMAKLDANGKDAGVDANGVPIVLTPGGVISSHA